MESRPAWNFYQRGRMGKYKTTKKDFEIFTNECEKWINKLGLSGWEISYQHEDYGDNRAICTTNLNSKICNFYLCVSWEYKPSLSELKSCAEHEIIHLLLAPVINPLCSMFSYDSYIEEREHDILHKIQGLMK